MSEEPIIVSYEDALTVVPPRGKVHCMVQNSFALIGADWDRRAFLSALKRAKSIQIGGPACRASSHGLVVLSHDNRTLFFEANDDALSALEAKHAIPE